MIKLQRGIITRAAKDLGVTRQTIYRGIEQKKLDVIQKLYDLQTELDNKRTLARKLYTHLEKVHKN